MSHVCHFHGTGPNYEAQETSGAGGVWENGTLVGPHLGPPWHAVVCASLYQKRAAEPGWPHGVLLSIPAVQHWILRRDQEEKPKNRSWMTEEREHILSVMKRMEISRLHIITTQISYLIFNYMIHVHLIN